MDCECRRTRAAASARPKPCPSETGKYRRHSACRCRRIRKHRPAVPHRPPGHSPRRGKLPARRAAKLLLENRGELFLGLATRPYRASFQLFKIKGDEAANKQRSVKLEIRRGASRASDRDGYSAREINSFMISLVPA